MTDLQQQQQQQQGANGAGDHLTNGTSSSSGNGPSSAAEEAAAGGDAAMADLDYEPEALSQPEVAVLDAAAALLDTATGVLKSFSRCLLEGGAQQQLLLLVVVCLDGMKHMSGHQGTTAACLHACSPERACTMWGRVCLLQGAHGHGRLGWSVSTRFGVPCATCCTPAAVPMHEPAA
jgi:hypothetical protein